MHTFRRLRLRCARRQLDQATRWQRYTRARYANVFGLRLSDWPDWARREHAKLTDDVTRYRRRVERLTSASET